MNFHTGNIDFIAKALPPWTRFKMLFVRSRYGFDQTGNTVTFVRSKTVNNTIYVLERGEFPAEHYRLWAVGRDLSPSRRK